MPKFKGLQDIARAIDCINVYPNLLGLHHGLHQTLPDKYLGVSDGTDHIASTTLVPMLHGATF